MLVTYEGIVVGRRDVGDSGCFIDILTDEQGIVEAKAHGVKKLQSSVMSSAALFSYSTFCMSKNGLRYTVNSAKPKFSFHDLGKDIEKLALASYFAQAVRYCISSEQAQSERNDNSDSMVRFLAISLYEVLNCRTEDCSLAAVKAGFELRFCRELGFAPNLVACDNCGAYDCEGGMYFLPDKAKLICADCLYVQNAVRLLPETLFAMRNITFSPLEKCFKFGISAAGAEQLGEICERYFLDKVERSFPALDYYKSVRI
ncbi:MAG: DNA repair protein RecO [Oscillospiraceae bacterium]